MKIESVRIRNFRAIKDEAITFSGYTCLLGANGAGKSTILHALNIFFRETANVVTHDAAIHGEEVAYDFDATPSQHMTYLVTEWGKPFTAPGFGNKFRDWCDEAGLRQCSAHGIRKFDATTAAENGATEHQLMAMFGWDSPKQAGVYTRKANRSKLAKGAMHLLAPPDENKKVS